MSVPIYLKKYTDDIKELPGFQDNDWFKDLSWKGKLHFNKEHYFSIYFEGIRYEDETIGGEDDSPLLIYAINMKDKEKILIFDERIHGYESLLIEKKEFSKRATENIFIDNNGNSLFEVFIWTNTSVDFLDEFKFENNKTNLLNGELVDLSYLESNAFDAFGIILRDKDNKYITLLEMELS